MNKKQRNRKIVAQNQRNRIINKRYLSTIKNLSKLFVYSVKNKKTIEDKTLQEIEKQKILKLMNNLYSFIDKAIKKSVIHKNTAARKKSRISKMLALNN